MVAACAIDSSSGGAMLAFELGVVVMKVREHGRRDRQHHHRGGRVGDPRRDRAGGRHEAEHQARRRASERMDDPERHAPVQVPALDRHRDHQAAEEEQVGLARVGARDVVGRIAPVSGSSTIGTMRGDGRRQRFGEPPRRHQRAGGGGPLTRRPGRPSSDGSEADQQECEDAADEPEATDHRHGLSLCESGRRRARRGCPWRRRGRFPSFATTASCGEASRRRREAPRAGSPASRRSSRRVVALQHARTPRARGTGCVKKRERAAPAL